MRNILCTLLFTLAAMTAFSQTKTVSGVVLSADSKEPIIGATVRAKNNAKHGRLTDINGKFSFQVPEGTKRLLISYVGMEDATVAVGTNLKILLSSKQEMLDEVVVIAYGTAKKESLVGSQVNVNAKKLKKRPITNISNALNAAAPGVQVTTSGGQPGSGADVMIRGFGSVNASSKPIYVVDGAIFTGSIADIPMHDVKSLSVLKDAASTALYGSSAGNGVILITTRSGSMAKQGSPKFEVSYSKGFSRRGQEDYDKIGAMEYYPIKWQQWFNDYHYTSGVDPKQAGYWANYELLKDQKINPYAGVKTGAKFNREQGWSETTNASEWNVPLVVMPDGQLNPEITGLLWPDDTNWEKYLFRTGMRTEYALNGGYNTDKMRSYLSMSYMDEDGYKLFSNFNRLSSRLNLSYDVNSWLSLGTKLSYVRSRSESPKRASGGFAANSFLFVSRVAPIYPVHKHNEDGSYVLDEGGNKVYDYNGDRLFNTRFNPVYEQEIDKSYGSRDAVNSRSFVEFKFLPSLSLRLNYSYDLYSRSGKTRYNNIMGDQPQGLLIISGKRAASETFNQLLNYKKNLGEHEIDALLGHESYEYIESSYSMNKEGMGILGIDEMANLAKMSDMGSVTDRYAKEGYFGRLSWNYGHRYNLSASYRRDGTSKLHRDRRWGNFWSLGLGWNIAKESFMQGTENWLDYLKFRASMGQTGNDAIGGFYPYQTTFNLGWNNENFAGLRFRSLGNPDLLWETQTSYDAAFEFSLFKRLKGAIEFFNKESKDLLFAFPLPTSTGIGSVNKNIGKVRNYGLEVDLKLSLINRRDFYWDIFFNGTHYKNKIVRLPEENREDGIETGIKKYVEGGSIQDFYLDEFIKVDPKDGLAIYRLDSKKYPDVAPMGDKDEQKTWTKDGRFAKKHFCGSSIPDLYGGFGTDLFYKGFSFNVLFSYQLGGLAFDGGYQGLMGRQIGGGSAMHVDIRNAWRKPGQVTDVPRLDAGDAGKYDNKTSDRFLISASALMLKSVSLSYDLPKRWVDPLKIRGVRIGIAGENLFLKSKRKGFNPMVNYSGISGTPFYEYAKMVTATINVSL